jgi:hypothetical protein
MRSIAILGLLVLASLACYGQDIPPGVRYKGAPDGVNEQARQMLAAVLAGKETVPDSLCGDVIVCGPTLWNAIKDAAPDELKSATVMAYHIPTKKGDLKLEGRAFKTAALRTTFWKLFLKKYGSQTKPNLRKANAEELSYYWATIPYDIEEPLYISEIGKVRILFDFVLTTEAPKLFTIDLVGSIPDWLPSR